MIKKIALITGIISALCFTWLFVNYAVNEKTIKNYKNEIYKTNSINSVLGFAEPYVYHYNKGNVYYKKGDYKGAEEEYKKALESQLKDEKDCSTRINLALSMVTPIDEKSITKDNIDGIIERLKEAKAVLTQNECACEDRVSGHNEDAQTLWNEIDDFQKKLEQQKENQNGQDGDPDQNQPQSGQDQKEQSIGKDKDTKQQLQDIQDEGMQERNSNLDTYEAYKSGFDYYDGQTW